MGCCRPLRTRRESSLPCTMRLPALRIAFSSTHTLLLMVLLYFYLFLKFAFTDGRDNGHFTSGNSGHVHSGTQTPTQDYFGHFQMLLFFCIFLIFPETKPVMYERSFLQDIAEQNFSKFLTDQHLSIPPLVRIFQMKSELSGILL